MLNGEFLEILAFSDRTGKKTFRFCISELENDAGSYHTTLKVCSKTAHLSVKNNPKLGKYNAMFREVKVEFRTVGRVVARQTCNIKMAAWAP